MRKLFNVAILLMAVCLISGLSACGAGTRTGTAYTPRQLAEVVIAAQEVAPPLYPLLPGEENYDNYVSEIYMFEPGDEPGDGIIFYAGGFEACEIAVFLFDGSDGAAGAEDVLSTYKERRAAVFTGYAPQQAALTDRGLVVRQGDHVALLICEDAESAASVFRSCFGNNPPALPDAADLIHIAQATSEQATEAQSASTQSAAAQATSTQTTAAPAETTTAAATAATTAAIAAATTTEATTTTATTAETTTTTAATSAATTTAETTTTTTEVTTTTSAATTTTATTAQPTMTTATSETTTASTTAAQTQELTTTTTEASTEGTQPADGKAHLMDLNHPDYDLAEDVYDHSAVLAAWRGGGRDSLTYKNRTIMDICFSVINSEIKSGMSEYDKELAIHDWIIARAEYDKETLSNAPDASPNPDNENPFGLLVGGVAICRGYTSTFQLFMDMLGIECITVDGTARETEPHAWNMVRLDGEWYCVDVTWNDPLGVGTGNTNINIYMFHRFFNATSQFLRENDHQWDEAGVPEATADKYAWKPIEQ